MLQNAQNNMCVSATPLEFYPDYNLWVKREDLCCPGGPNFSKTRGVWAHMLAHPSELVGVLDTTHSQGGWAVARAASLLGRRCQLYYPRLKADPPTLRPQHQAAQALGADIRPMRPMMSAVLWHQARKLVEVQGGYMFPNALKLPESVEETAKEVALTDKSIINAMRTVIVSISSGTLAAGVLRGLCQQGYQGTIVFHMGYSRPQKTVWSYITKAAGVLWESYVTPVFIDEGYTYADKARPGPEPPFPSNEYYDRKAFAWWAEEGRRRFPKPALLWNIG